jgi:VanZ family protein
MVISKNELMRFCKHPALRGISTLSWTGLVVIVMVASSKTTLVGNLHKAGGGTSATDTIGHVVIFGVLAFLWWWSLILQSSQRNALFGALIISLALGISTEVLQALVPGRGVTVCDLLANCFGAITVLGVIGIFHNTTTTNSITPPGASSTLAKNKSHRSNDPS